jgi:hypothetical protein
VAGGGGRALPRETTGSLPWINRSIKRLRRAAAARETATAARPLPFAVPRRPYRTAGSSAVAVPSARVRIKRIRLINEAKPAGIKQTL